MNDYSHLDRDSAIQAIAKHYTVSEPTAEFLYHNADSHGGIDAIDLKAFPPDPIIPTQGLINYIKKSRDVDESTANLIFNVVYCDIESKRYTKMPAWLHLKRKRKSQRTAEMNAYSHLDRDSAIQAIVNDYTVSKFTAEFIYRNADSFGGIDAIGCENSSFWC